MYSGSRRGNHLINKLWLLHSKCGSFFCIIQKKIMDEKLINLFYYNDGPDDPLLQS